MAEKWLYVLRWSASPCVLVNNDVLLAWGDAVLTNTGAILDHFKKTKPLRHTETRVYKSLEVLP